MNIEDPGNESVTLRLLEECPMDLSDGPDEAGIVRSSTTPTNSEGPAAEGVSPMDVDEQPSPSEPREGRDMLSDQRPSPFLDFESIYGDTVTLRRETPPQSSGQALTEGKRARVFKGKGKGRVNRNARENPPTADNGGTSGNSVDGDAGGDNTEPGETSKQVSRLLLSRMNMF